MKNKWSDQDKQAFGDGNRLRASSVPGKKRPGATAAEWTGGSPEYLQRLEDSGALDRILDLEDAFDAGVDFGPGLTVEELKERVQRLRRPE